MKKFRFKLEKYLEVTRRKKEDAELKFAEATRLLDEAREYLQQLFAGNGKGTAGLCGAYR